MASSSSPCAACKFLRRKCTQECMFAPYFPADQPQKFANVHKVFGASNVAKLLNELPVSQREDAVNSLAYEAETRRRDPVYGCVGLISILQQRLKLLQNELHMAQKELASYIGPHQPMVPMLQPPRPAGVAGFALAQPAMMQHLRGNPSSSTGVPYNMAPMMGIPTSARPLVIRESGPRSNNNGPQMLDPEQLATAVGVRDQQEMIRAFESVAGSSSGVGVIGFGPNNPPRPVSPSLMLGSYDSTFGHHQQQHHLSLQPQQVMAVQEHHQKEHECRQEQPQGLDGDHEAEPGRPSC